MKTRAILNIVGVVVLALFSANSFSMTIERRTLLVFHEEGSPPLLRPAVGKSVVTSLLLANGKTKTTTSSRLENKRVVRAHHLERAMAELLEQGYELEDREVKNLAPGERAGTFTFYGTAVKFIEAKNLPKTSIKMRVRIYVIEHDGMTRRSGGTINNAFLEIKIKNPFPEYPLSVHKYRLVLPDQDILSLIKSDPTDQEAFTNVIENLKQRAHENDADGKNSKLIDAMFDQIRIMAIAEPNFIKPTIGITYFRASKKYDEEYTVEAKKKKFGRKHAPITKTRSYEITIDQNLKAFHADFSDDDNAIVLDKYYEQGDDNDYLIANYPNDARVVEFKQPDAIGYDGPGKIRKPEAMMGAQKALWEAFVGKLGDKAVKHSRPDAGKFFHVKQYMRIQEGRGEEGEESILVGP